MTEVFYGLAVLACPIGMGMMMWMMMRGGHGRAASPHSTSEPEIAQLRAEVEQLRAVQGGGTRPAGADVPQTPQQP